MKGTEYLNSGAENRLSLSYEIYQETGVGVPCNIKVWLHYALQSPQSRTRSSEIAFLRSLKNVKLIGNTRTEPH